MAAFLRLLRLNGTPPRNRFLLLGILLVVIAVGLFSRSDSASALPDVFGIYAGDTLWTLAIYLALAILAHRAHPALLGLTSLLISYTVEFSQLIDTPWLNALRDTLFGALVLGAGFLGSDFVCYTVGGLMGVCLDVLIWKGQRETAWSRVPVQPGSH